MNLADDFITVYHSSPLEKPPHLFPRTENAEKFMGNMPTANMHAGTMESALHRVMGTGLDNNPNRLLPSIENSYIHSYRVPKSIIDISTEYLDEAGIEGNLPANTVQNFNNQENLKKVLPYINAKEDIGSTSYLLPKKMIGQEIQFIGTAQISDDVFIAAEQNVLKKAGITSLADWDGTIKNGDKTISGSDAFRELKSRALDDIRQQDLSKSLVFSQKETYWPGIHPEILSDVSSPTSISTRSNRIPAIALDLDKTIFKTTPKMQAAEEKAIEFLKSNPQADLSLRVKAWEDWEKLAVGNLQPNKEMLGFVKQLQNSGISMNVMTARSTRIQEQTLGLLEKMGFIPDEVFFRPYTLPGEMAAADKMKVDWIKGSSEKFDYVSIFDDSGRTVKSALESGLVRSAFQPSAGVMDKKFLQGALERGLETMKATFSTEPNRFIEGISQMEDLIEKASTKNVGRMLGAAAEASAAVAGGIKKSDILRNAAAAATILKRRIID